MGYALSKRAANFASVKLMKLHDERFFKTSDACKTLSRCANLLELRLKSAGKVETTLTICLSVKEYSRNVSTFGFRLPSKL
mmetsp:Transcript_22638/g.39083  ORF Transcript_22638/g.39083 Transcript_22638/m.39083 type:complete len:81 (+) Transcript_22638:5-247(+)